MKITVKESIIVRPAGEASSRRIFLSNLDLGQGNGYVPIIYVYEPDGSSDFFDVELLKEALSKVLVPFYPLAGRFGIDENGRLEINCNGEGVLFIEAEADCPMTNFNNEFMPDRAFVELVPEVDYSTEVSSLYFFLAQVTKFSCGGVCLGVQIHHEILDGQAIFQFMNSWAETARGVSLTIPPVHKRSLLRARDPPTPRFNHTEYNVIQNFKPGARVAERFLVAVPKFSVEFVNSLKAKVMSKESNVKYSTFEVLSAHLWRCASKLRNLPHDQENSLIIPVNGRRRLQPPLPEGYFGNATFITIVRASNGELIREPLEKTVERIHKAIIKMNDDYLRSSIDYLEKEDPVKYTNAVANRTFLINSWVRLNQASTDFGWGGYAYKQLAGEFGGIVTFLANNNDDNTLSVYVGLPEEETKLLEKLIYVLE